MSDTKPEFAAYDRQVQEILSLFGSLSPCDVTPKVTIAALRALESAQTLLPSTEWESTLNQAKLEGFVPTPPLDPNPIFPGPVWTGDPPYPVTTGTSTGNTPPDLPGPTIVPRGKLWEDTGLSPDEVVLNEGIVDKLFKEMKDRLWAENVPVRPETSFEDSLPGPRSEIRELERLRALERETGAKVLPGQPFVRPTAPHPEESARKWAEANEAGKL